MITLRNKTPRYNVGDTVTIVPSHILRPLQNNPKFRLGVTVINEMLGHGDRRAEITHCRMDPRGYAIYTIRFLGQTENNIYGWDASLFLESYDNIDDDEIDMLLDNQLYHGQLIFHRIHTDTNNLSNPLIFVYNALDNHLYYNGAIEIRALYEQQGTYVDFSAHGYTRYSSVIPISTTKAVNHGRVCIDVNGNLKDFYIPSDLEIKQVLPFLINAEQSSSKALLDVPDVLNLKSYKYPLCVMSYMDNKGSYRNGYAFLLPNKTSCIALTGNRDIKFEKNITLANSREVNKSDYANLLQKYFYVTIKACEKSTEVFGHGRIKRSMVNKTDTVNGKPIKYKFKVNKVLLNYEKDDTHYHVVEVYNPDMDKNYKFLLEDLEVVTYSLNGFNEPKNRTITKNCDAKIIKDKLLPVKNKTIVKVLEVVNRTPKGSLIQLNKNTKVIVQAGDKKFQCKIKNLKRV